jgi:hypothetical protein
MDYQSDEQRPERQREGATLSDKTARSEFGLTQDEIYDAIDAGTLQFGDMATAKALYALLAPSS